MKTDNFILDNFTKVGLFISGGLDSSLMLYLITKEIKEKNSNVEFITYTVEQHSKNTKQHVNAIIKVVEKLNGVKIENVEVGKQDYAHPDFEVMYGVLDALNRERFTDKMIDMIYLAATCVPDDLKNVNGVPKRHAQSFFKVSQPWGELSKDHIVNYILQNNLTDLIKTTHSCTVLGNSHCGECWNCKERIWAFEKNNSKDLAF
jgi:7-cyano-7-deazaguanine synthase in queuosine biosynthesis